MSGPHPAVAAVRHAVRAALAASPDGVPADGVARRRVLVACSGGTDSFALAAATAFVAPRLGIDAGAVVVDHGWHSGSAEVAAAVARTCAALGLDPVTVATVHPGPEGGPEAAARSARYAALEDARQAVGADTVLLGHTLDDQAETVLLGLARGSGARSLAGMRARRGALARPLLELPRAATREACAALGLVPWQDPSNTDPRFTRVRARELLPALDGALGPGLPAALARTADLLREDADALDGYAADLLARATVPLREPRPGPARDLVALDVAVLAAAPDAVRRRALLAAARAVGSPPGSLGRRHAVAMDALVTRWRGQGPVQLPRAVARRNCGTLLVAAPGGDPQPFLCEHGTATGHRAGTETTEIEE